MWVLYANEQTSCCFNERLYFRIFICPRGTSKCNKALLIKIWNMILLIAYLRPKMLREIFFPVFSFVYLQYRSFVSSQLPLCFLFQNGQSKPKQLALHHPPAGVFRGFYPLENISAHFPLFSLVIFNYTDSPVLQQDHLFQQWNISISF